MDQYSTSVAEGRKYQSQQPKPLKKIEKTFNQQQNQLSQQKQYRLHTEHSQSQSNSISQISLSQPITDENYMRDERAEVTKQSQQRANYASQQEYKKLTKKNVVEAPPNMQQIDLSAILKQMTKEQIQQLLSDPEVAKILQTQSPHQNNEPKGAQRTAKEYNLTSEGDDANFLGYEPPLLVRKKNQNQKIPHQIEQQQELTTGVGEGEVNFDNMQVQTESNGSSEEINLAFQLLEDEVMDAKMANFIGIHMLNEIIGTDVQVTESDLDRPDQYQVEGQYQDPETGCHFDYHDLVRRIKILQKRRAIIDQAIRDEQLMEKQKKARHFQEVNQTHLQQSHYFSREKVHLTDGDELSSQGNNMNDELNLRQQPTIIQKNSIISKRNQEKRLFTKPDKQMNLGGNAQKLEAALSGYAQANLEIENAIQGGSEGYRTQQPQKLTKPVIVSQQPQNSFIKKKPAQGLVATTRAQNQVQMLKKIVTEQSNNYTNQNQGVVLMRPAPQFQQSQHQRQYSYDTQNQKYLPVQGSLDLHQFQNKNQFYTHDVQVKMQEKVQANSTNSNRAHSNNNQPVQQNQLQENLSNSSTTKLQVRTQDQAKSGTHALKHGVLTLAKGQAKLQVVQSQSRDGSQGQNQNNPLPKQGLVQQAQVNNFFKYVKQTQPSGLQVGEQQQQSMRVAAPSKMQDPYDKQSELYAVLCQKQKKQKTGTHARGNTFDNRVGEQQIKPQVFIFEKRPVSSNSKSTDKKKVTVVGPNNQPKKNNNLDDNCASISQLSPTSNQNRKQSEQKPPKQQVTSRLYSKRQPPPIQVQKNQNTAQSRKGNSQPAGGLSKKTQDVLQTKLVQLSHQVAQDASIANYAEHLNSIRVAIQQQASQKPTNGSKYVQRGGSLKLTSTSNQVFKQQ